ncbi:hypothetical protein DB346_07110 [Verrucomicrobia bacterium LW23]|nr:hypothetical protein DB346_07110 [Verrucomicrobia bacterium LW23]
MTALDALTPRQRDLLARAAQSYLRGLGYDLGETGPRRDGVDGDPGKLTRDALVAWGDRAFPAPPAKPAAPELTAEMRAWYRNLWDSMRIGDAPAIVNAVSLITRARPRYEAIEKQTGVPWRVVGVLHYLECNCNFARHLHNGDPLTARTVQVPKGRPATGNPPFPWEASAQDALQYDGLAGQSDWSIEATLFRLEKFNGWGYFKFTDILSPYLWSMSNHYTRGKYVSDGEFDSAAVSKQVGAAVLLAVLAKAP